jgi:hypothetical protein
VKSACRNGEKKMPSSPWIRCGMIPAATSRSACSPTSSASMRKSTGTTAHIATKARPSEA